MANAAGGLPNEINVEYRVFKVCVVGPKHSGKTSFINCYLNSWGNGYFPGFTGDSRLFCKVDKLDSSSITDQKPYYLLLHDMIAFNDPALKYDVNMQNMLSRVVENPSNPLAVELGRFPWEQEQRHYSAYVFVVNGTDKKSFGMTASFIKEISRREEHKAAGKYPKLTSTKVIVKTHSDLCLKEKTDNGELSGLGIEIKEASSVTGEGVPEVFSYIFEMLGKDPQVELYEKLTWQNSSNRLAPDKEENENQEESEEEDDPEDMPQYDDIKDLRLEKLDKGDKKKSQGFFQKLFRF